MHRPFYLVPAADDFDTDVTPRVFELDDTVEIPQLPPVPAPRPRRRRTDRRPSSGWVVGLVLAVVFVLLFVFLPVVG